MSTPERAHGEGHWAGWPACPCGCALEGLKLTRSGHVIGCSCRSCTGRRSRRKGQGAQREMHRALGGTGHTPSNEESARPYVIEVTVMPESKTGGQVPASFQKFISTDWFRRALNQAERGAPVGSGVIPAVVVNGKWLIADLKPKPGQTL